MLNHISWANYGTFILITSFVYYVTIGCLYYINEIKQVLSGKSTFLLRFSGTKNIVTKNINGKDKVTSNHAIQSGNEFPPYVNQFIAEIQSKLENVAKHGAVKQDVIYSLQQLTGKYSTVKDSPFKSYISNYILNECANYCSVHLDDDELKMIWVSKMDGAF